MALPPSELSKRYAPVALIADATQRINETITLFSKKITIFALQNKNEQEFQ